MAIEWKRPPENTGRNASGNGKWQAVVAELAQRPGEWALVGQDVNASVTSYLKARHPGTEWTTRGVNGNRAAELYGRFVG